MTVIDNLLIASPTLQDALVDKMGDPLVNGVVTFFEDTDRTVLKNVYYETGSPGSYTFVQLNNPLTLSAAGSIIDPSGNDTIPFFYPYDETSSSTTPPVQKYYIVVTDSAGNLQFTRQDFPYDLSTNATPSGGGSGGAGASFENLVINNEFWRNIGSSINPFTTANTAPIILAPSQHDAMRFPDIEYIVVGTGDTETVSFVKFSGPGQTLTGDITPEYYLDFDCTVSTGGETSKIISIPLSTHLLTLAGFQGATFTVQANSPTASNLEVNIIGDYGSNGMAQIVQHLGTIVLNSSWTKYTFAFNFPDIVTADISATADDGWYLQFVLPNTASHIEIAKPSVFLTALANVPTNDFATYDQIDTVINDFRTGDVRSSMNTFAPYGWVPANDGVISNAGSYVLPANIPSSRQNADTWPLFNLLWQNAKPHDSGSTFNPICQMFDNTGAAVDYGASPYADFVTNNRQMQIPLMLGRALLGLPPGVTVTYDHTATPSWGSVAGTFTVASTILLYVGAPVYLTGTVLPGAFTANKVYYVIPAIDGSDTTKFQLATTYANALAGTAIAASGAVDGTALIINWTLGSTGSNATAAIGFGQSRHQQLTNEVGSHQHGPPVGSGGAFLASGNDTVNSRGAGVTTIFATGTLTAANTPSGYPANIVQPSVYLNVFFKL